MFSLPALARKLRPCVSVGRRSARIVEEQWSEIYIQDEIGVHRPRPNLTWITHEKRHPQRLFVHQPLIEESVVAKKEPLVRRIDHDRVVGEVFVSR